MRLDPIQLEILNNKVTSIAEEAGFTVQRTGRTLYVKETADFGTALVNLEGRFFAYPSAIGVSGFIDLDCGPTIRAVPHLGPGDVIITNDPYGSEGLATHTPDLHLVAPIFYRDRLVCYSWSFLHSSDVGGRVPGSISPSSSELFQEGLIMPPVRLCIGGQLNPDIVSVLRANTRTPNDNLADIQAMLAAHTVAARRIAEVIDQHGLDTFMQCQIDLIEYAALKAREVLRKLPDGVYEFWDYLDDDLVSRIPLRIRVKMTVRDGRVELDFTGTDPQTDAAFNVPTGGKRHAWLTLRLMAFICTHDKTMPLNSGIFENVTVRVRKGTLLNPEFPAPVGVRHATAIRISDVLNGALLKAAPTLMPACSGGVVIPIVFAEPSSVGGGRNVLVVEPMVGGMGARQGHDGVDGRDSGISNLSNNPIETVEASAALVIRDYAVRPDSGGAGRWRGGVGLNLTFEVLSDGVSVLGRGMERLRFQPWGFAGGQPGANAQTIVNRGRPNEREVGKIDLLALQKGDTFSVLTPGGGGFGPSWEREPEAVQRDARRGFVTREGALRDYAVVLDDSLDVDRDATVTRRRSLGSRRDDGAFRFGPEREAWERFCDDASLCRMNAALERFPASQRAHARRRVFEQIFGGDEHFDRPLQDVLSNPEHLRKRLQAAIVVLEATVEQGMDA
jgi:N-methylhydantoinase B